MNIRDLTYLVAVAEHGHFGKAAESCHVSQPALSMQIQKLEDTLGVQLFERSNKHVLVTEVGKDIAARARTILQEVEQLTDAAHSHHNPFAGELKLGAFPTLAPYILPSIVPKIRKQLPDLRLLLVEDKTQTLLDKLHSGVLDCALIALPFPDDNLAFTPLFEDPFMLAVPPQHRFAKRKKIRLADIAGEQLLLLEDGHCLRSQALEVCSMMGVSEHQDFRATSMETLRQMVASDVGITLIPSLAQKKNDGVVYIPFTGRAPSRSIGLVWRKSSARITAFEKIAAIITQTM